MTAELEPRGTDPRERRRFVRSPAGHAHEQGVKIGHGSMPIGQFAPEVRVRQQEHGGRKPTSGQLAE